MIQGIALQAVYSDPSDEPHQVQARQVIIVPAGRQMWIRTVSEAHPKKVWRKRPAWAYEISSPWSSANCDEAFQRDWNVRGTATWHLTGAPVGFQMTDDEFGELVSREMNRNVALRFHRALAATGQTVLGERRALTPAACRMMDIPALDALGGIAWTSARLAAELSRIVTAISENDTHVLNEITPTDARARGAGPHRNEHALPGVAEPKPNPIIVVIPEAAPEPEPEPGPEEPSVVKPGDRITAADGVVYVARKVDSDERDLSDVALFRRAYAHGMNVLLLGEPGTGKTRGLLAAFPNAIVVPVTGDTEVSDLIGSYVPTGPDTFAWVDGPLIRAMDEGRMLIMDEGGLADSKVLAVLYPLLDKKGDARKLLITANPARGTVAAKDGFGVSFTTNPNAKGVHLAEPLLSRCALIMEVTTDYAVARSLGCNERIVQAAEHMSKQRENGEMAWAPEMRDLLDAKRLEEKFGLLMALRALIMHAPEMEREVVETQLRERFGDVPGAAKKVKGLKI